MPGTQAAKRNALVRKIVLNLSALTVIGIILAFIGPFGTYELPLATRLVGWIGMSWAGYLVYGPVESAVEWLHRTLDLPRAPLWIACTLVATVPMAALVWAAGALTWGAPIPSADVALAHYLNVLVVGAGVTFVMATLGEARQRREAQAAPEPSSPPVPDVAPVPAASPAARFLDRLPPHLGSDLLALEMEDHYVRAHTALGSDLVLMRLRDAMTDLAGVEGMQVHRSWWVARHAVADVRREGRNLRLVLANGIEAPVARAQAATLRDAGWI